MALIIPPGYAQVTHSWSITMDPEPMSCVLGLDLSGTGDLSTLAAALASDFQNANAAGGRYAPWSYRGVVLRVGQDGGPPGIYEAPLSVLGTANGPTPPNNCAMLVRKVTGAGGRANRGRLFLPCFNVDEASVDAGGNVTSAALTAYQAFITDWLDTSVYNYVILHDSTSPEITPTPILNHVVQPKIATQRRRMRK
jgi:hypothetical protein